MSKVIVLIATTVIAINLLYTMLPGGSCEKYCKYIFGLILVLIFAGTVVKFDISSRVLNFNNNVPVFETTKITEIVHRETEELISENIQSMLKSKRIIIKNINVTLSDGEIKEVKIEIRDNANKSEIVSIVSSYCDINEEKIVIE